MWAFFGNIWLTMRGQWDRFLTNLPLRFVLVGFFMYILANVQGALQADAAVQRDDIHFTFFVIGHSHLALLGGFTILGMGVVYYIVPYRSEQAAVLALAGGTSVLAGHGGVPRFPPVTDHCAASCRVKAG